MLCAECGTDFTSRFKKAKFCKPLCKQRWFRHNSPKSLVAVTCPICQEIRWLALRGSDASITSRRCSACATDAMSGSQSPRWKGGHRHWSPGRLGRDKDGLSWRIQRRLAWERDNYTCQECGTKSKRNPDVHHIVPFRVSQSHALENLKCLCKKCHITEESKVQAKWGGQTFTSTRPRTGHYCTECDRRIQGAPWTKVAGKVLCRLCKQAHLIPEAQRLRAEGKTLDQMGEILGISPMAASYYARGITSSARVKKNALVAESVRAPGLNPGD